MEPMITCRDSNTPTDRPTRIPTLSPTDSPSLAPTRQCHAFELQGTANGEFDGVYNMAGVDTLGDVPSSLNGFEYFIAKDTVAGGTIQTEILKY